MLSTNTSQKLATAAKSLGMICEPLGPERTQLAQFVANCIITDVDFTSETGDNKIHRLSFTFGPGLRFTRSRRFEHSGHLSRDWFYGAVLQDVKNLVKFQIDHPKVIQFFQRFRDLDCVRDIKIDYMDWGPASASASIRQSDGSWKTRYFGSHSKEEMEMGTSFDLIILLKELILAFMNPSDRQAIERLETPAPAPSFSRILKLEPDPRPEISTTHLVFQKTDDDEVGLYKIHNFDHKTMVVRDGCIYSRQGGEANLNLEAIYEASAKSMDTGDWYAVGFELGENFDRKCTYIIISNPKYEESHRAALRLFNILVAHLA